MMSTPLARLSTVEAAPALSSAAMAILPLGAIEQHGPHLSLETDIAISTALSLRLAERLGPAALLLPPMPYGLSEHHISFAGTLTLRANTLMAIIRDLTESLASHGISRILIVNGHGGNIDGIRLAAREAKRDHNSRIAHVMWGSVVSDAIAQEMTGHGMHNHACEIETSLALHLNPELIRGPLPEPMLEPEFAPHIAPPSARVDTPLSFDELTPTGALGNPSRATAELGRKLTDLFIERTLEFARAFADPAFPLVSTPSAEHLETK